MSPLELHPATRVSCNKSCFLKQVKSALCLIKTKCGRGFARTASATAATPGPRPLTDEHDLLAAILSHRRHLSGHESERVSLVTGFLLTASWRLGFKAQAGGGGPLYGGMGLGP